MPTGNHLANHAAWKIATVLLKIIIWYIFEDILNYPLTKGWQMQNVFLYLVKFGLRHHFALYAIDLFVKRNWQLDLKWTKMMFCIVIMHFKSKEGKFYPHLNIFEIPCNNT